MERTPSVQVPQATLGNECLITQMKETSQWLDELSSEKQAEIAALPSWEAFGHPVGNRITLVKCPKGGDCEAECFLVVEPSDHIDPETNEVDSTRIFAGFGIAAAGLDRSWIFEYVCPEGNSVGIAEQSEAEDLDGDSDELKQPEDVIDLLELMGDTGMVRVMRRAVADEQEMRERPAAVFDNSEEGRRNAEMLTKLFCGMATLEEAGPAFFRDRDGTLGVKIAHHTSETQRPAELLPGIPREQSLISSVGQYFVRNIARDEKPSELANSAFYAGVLAAKEGLVDVEAFHSDRDDIQPSHTTTQEQPEVDG